MCCNMGESRDADCEVLCQYRWFVVCLCCCDGDKTSLDALQSSTTTQIIQFRVFTVINISLTTAGCFLFQCSVFGAVLHFKRVLQRNL